MGRISMPQGKGSQMHNRRDFEKYKVAVPDNIDQSRSHENITFVDKDLKEAYDEIFGEALEQYNAKQKRKDRKIDNYLDHLSKSKNGEKLFYEDVLQWGKKEDFEDPVTRQRACSALLEYISKFEERNPNLKLIGAYIHMDEASPHLHFDYIPVATGYKNGLAMRNSLDKAMKQMGHIPEKESKLNNATKLWKETERAYFAEICRSYGLEVEAERAWGRKQLTVEEYKEATEDITQEAEKQAQRATEAQAQANALQAEIKANTERAERQRATYEKNKTLIDRQVEAYNQNKAALEHNNRILEEQEEQIRMNEDLIKFIDNEMEYQEQAEAIGEAIDSMEKQMETLPRLAKVFKEREARSIITDFIDCMKMIANAIQSGITRLKAYEYYKGSEKMLSEPLEERKESLMDKLRDAEAKSKAQAKQPSKGYKKEGPER